MRLVDADALGNRMYHESFEKDSDLQKWDGGCWIRYKLFEQVLRAAPTIDPQKWISCSERLPNEYERMETYSHPDRASSFIVTIKGANIPTVLYLTDDNYWKDENGHYYSVSAWQPLPEPWKEG